MNRLHINHSLALVLLLVGAMTLMMVAFLYQPYQTPTTDTVRLSSDAIPKPNVGKPDNGPSHRMIYGKYCLGEFLHGR